MGEREVVGEGRLRGSEEKGVRRRVEREIGVAKRRGEG